MEVSFRLFLSSSTRYLFVEELVLAQSRHGAIYFLTVENLFWYHKL